MGIIVVIILHNMAHKSGLRGEKRTCYFTAAVVRSGYSAAKYQSINQSIN
jgi:hypothetical protein